MKQNVVTIPRWFDRHFHPREGDLMKTVIPSLIAQRPTGAVFMLNLKEPVSTIERAKRYIEQIKPVIGSADFTPCLALYLTDDISPKEVVEGFKQGLWRTVKLYMADQNGQGGTTGSAHGVKNLLGRYKVFEAMEKHQIPLLGHFEAVEKEVDEFDREIVSVDRDLKPIRKSFEGLDIVFEHLTDGRAAEFVAESDHRLYATVTPHHPMINRNAMFWGGMNPGNYCKPVPKREIHRAKVRKYVTSGNQNFGAGTDNAAHDEYAKSRCYGCAAGIFSTPASVELYTTVFDEDDALQYLGPFLSENFLHIYGMKVSTEMMTIERTPMIVPEKVGNIQVFKGGETLSWKLVG